MKQDFEPCEGAGLHPAPRRDGDAQDWIRCPVCDRVFGGDRPGLTLPQHFRHWADVGR